MSFKITASRYHDISCGHRVVNHESKCAFLHGHNYRFHFDIQPAIGLDAIGRVLDFSVIKSHLCMWLEDNWDHKFLIWEHDPMLPGLREVSEESLVVVPFNPTAENLAMHLVDVVAPEVLAGLDCVLVSCKIEETRKCSATVEI